MITESGIGLYIANVDILFRHFVSCHIPKLRVGRHAPARRKLDDIVACSGVDDPVIRLHASEGIGVADVAMRLKISRRLLEMRFREILGVGVADEMRRVRLENVCRRLRGTKLPIKEIASKSGIASSSHLGAAFRHHYGMTMRDFRTIDAWAPHAMSSRNEN